MVRSRGTLGSIFLSILTAATSHVNNTYQDVPHTVCIMYGINTFIRGILMKLGRKEVEDHIREG